MLTFATVRFQENPMSASAEDQTVEVIELTGCSWLSLSHQGRPDWKVYAFHLHVRHGYAFTSPLKTRDQVCRKDQKWQSYAFFPALLCLTGHVISPHA